MSTRRVNNNVTRFKKALDDYTAYLIEAMKLFATFPKPISKTNKKKIDVINELTEARKQVALTDFETLKQDPSKHKLIADVIESHKRFIKRHAPNLTPLLNSIHNNKSSNLKHFSPQEMAKLMGLNNSLSKQNAETMAKLMGKNNKLSNKNAQNMAKLMGQSSLSNAARGAATRGRNLPKTNFSNEGFLKNLAEINSIPDRTNFPGLNTLAPNASRNRAMSAANKDYANKTRRNIRNKPLMARTHGV
jgi:uncharacterized protein YnzC (UPF0291/DUF896 family)